MVCPIFCCNNKGFTSREQAYGRDGEARMALNTLLAFVKAES